MERQMYYLACPSCKKKVVDDTTGYNCEKCQKVFDSAVPTYNFSLKISDYSSSIAVQELGENG